MNNFLLTVAGILVFILASLFAAPPLINWNDYRGVFEEEASRLLDREVRVRGKVKLRILPTPLRQLREGAHRRRSGCAGIICPRRPVQDVAGSATAASGNH